jgi:NifU-like protein involved in Fe-S cluster formation
VQGALAERLAEGLAEGFAHRQLPRRELEVFAPVSPHPSRQRCVRLGFESLMAAMAHAPGSGQGA